MSKKDRLIIVFFLVSVSGLSYAFVNIQNSYFEITKNLELFTNMFKELNNAYVDEIDPNKLTKAGIDAMLKSLDPYTSYISEEDIATHKLQITGKYGGIGALIRKSDDYVVIAEPYEGFPAFKAGLQAGDKLVKIAGESGKGKNTEQISKLLKGQPGTAVEVVIERLGEGELIRKIVREEIKIQSVPYYGMLDDKTGYIRLTSFTENCSKEVGKALKALKKNHNAQALVLDLRGNPGGLLNEAIDVANVFIDKNQEIVSTKSRKTDWDKTYRSSYKAIDTEIPLAILIDRSSASASEIVAGVIQDLDRGVIIGSRSFGKGLVQTTKSVGYNAKMKLTTAKYYLPSGRCIQAIDYSGGYNDNLEKIPDSLRTVFKTKKGRKVYDAGGIDPDIVVSYEDFGNITTSLVGKQLVFDYATQYKSTHPTLKEPKEFELTDEEFKDFVAFLKGKDYDYITKSEKLLKDLKESAAKEKYFTAIQEEISALETKIKHDKDKDLYKFKPEIKQLLEYEIASRYYYQKGRIEESLEDDKEIKEAFELFNNIDKYKKMINS